MVDVRGYTESKGYIEAAEFNQIRSERIRDWNPDSDPQPDGDLNPDSDPQPDKKR